MCKSSRATCAWKRKNKIMSLKNFKIVGAGVDPNTYHKQDDAKRGTPEWVMSSSHLREFGRCPSRWKKGYEFAGSASTEFGSLVDMKITTPQQFTNRYCAHPETYKNEDGEIKPWNGNSKVCKLWIKEAELMGFEIISQKEFWEASTAVKALLADDVIKRFIDSSDKQVYLTGEWRDEETSLVVPIKCLLDLVPRLDTEFYKSLGDLKTTKNAALQPWSRWCFTAGYHLQAALYRDGYAEATKEDHPNWCFLLCENFPPYQTGKRIMSNDFLEIGRADYRRLLANYCQCLKHNHWPDYDETDEAVGEWSIVSPEPWMADQAMFAPRIAFGDKGAELETADDGEVTP
jgi:hypothetical protein